MNFTRISQFISLNRVLVFVILLWVAYQLIATQWLLVGPIEHRNIHLAFAVIVILLSSIKKWPRLRWPLLALMLCHIAAAAYIQINYEELTMRIGFVAGWDMVVSIVILFAVFVTSYIAFGTIFAVFGLIVVVYVAFGQYLPEPFNHMTLPLPKILYYLCSIDSGILGTTLGISANYIFLFMVLSGLLEVSAGVDCFRELGKIAASRMRGGPAAIAVVASTIVGSITGSVSANIGICGTFTIPLMKKVGYKPEQAAAIEAVASSGGQIMPPVMGASGFVMASLLGIAYIMVCKMALIPALIYYMSLALFVQFVAVRMQIAPYKEKVNWHRMWVTLPVFSVPILVIIVLMVMGFTPMFAAFWSIISILAVASIRKETRLNFSQWTSGFVKGALQGAPIAVTTGLIGLLITSVTMTGLGMKLATLVEAVSLGNIIIALLITMVVSILLGTGLPTVAAYTIVGVIVAPVLVHMGVSWEQAHMFVLFYAVFSNLTPPVAIAALVASALAKADYMKTCWESMKVGAVAFITPFLFIAHPELLLIANVAPHLWIINLASIVLGFAALAIAINRAYLFLLKPLETALAIVSLLGFAGYLAVGNYIFLGAGVFFFATLTMMQLRQKRQLAKGAVS